MLAWVYDRAREASILSRLVVATDSDAIYSYCIASGFSVVMTSTEHRSGTERLIEVMERDSDAAQAADVYVNIQGDEPMVSAAHIDLLVSPFVQARVDETHEQLTGAGAASELAAAPGHAFPAQVSTLKVQISHQAALNPNAVKVVTNSRGLALYFSRAPIPYDRDGSAHARYYKHLGFYAYTAEALRQFRSLKPSPLELTESLEQLRFLEHGVPITVLETTEDTIGVDTEEDLERVEEYFRRMGLHSGPR